MWDFFLFLGIIPMACLILLMVRAAARASSFHKAQADACAMIVILRVYYTWEHFAGLRMMSEILETVSL